MQRTAEAGIITTVIIFVQKNFDLFFIKKSSVFFTIKFLHQSEFSSNSLRCLGSQTYLTRCVCKHTLIMCVVVCVCVCVCDEKLEVWSKISKNDKIRI